MNNFISRQYALESIEDIKSRIWDVDIPSPTVPEYIEHHEQMQSLMKACDEWINKLQSLPIEEHKKGSWLLTDFPDGQTYKCSECNTHWTFIAGTSEDGERRKE